MRTKPEIGETAVVRLRPPNREKGPVPFHGAPWTLLE